MLSGVDSKLGVCLTLTRAISRSGTVDDIYRAALDALGDGLGVFRASILLFDRDGVMRFKAHRGLSAEYRAAVEGHTPWTPESPDAQPIVVGDVRRDPSLHAFLPIIAAEGIAAMAFIPLVSLGRVIGKFMLYYPVPQELGAEDLQLAGVVAAQVAFAVERTRAEEKARQSEERLRFALEAAAMGTWDWDLTTQAVRWSAERRACCTGFRRGHSTGRSRPTNARSIPTTASACSPRPVAPSKPACPMTSNIASSRPTARFAGSKARAAWSTRTAGRSRMTGVCMMVTRRKEAELARLASAEEANRLKDEFLATLSHELRTPLNAILGWVQLLQADGLSRDRLQRALDVIGRNARLQAQLIEDILDVSRIITGKLEIDRVPVFVDQLLDTAINGVVPAADSKDIHLAREVSADLPPIEGDPKRLQQVFGNVLSNAIKFTPEGGQVAVACRHEAGAIAIEIRDSGAGIAPEFLPYVFDRFRQADCRATRRHGGLGLGLAVARHLIEQHRGEISARSEGLDRGTSVLMRLPEGTAVRLPATWHGPISAEVELRLDGVVVLVVDDERDSRDLLAALLLGCGAEVVQCDSAPAALEALAQRNGSPVQLVVADIAMPDVDGYELIARVRQVREGIPALAVSAYARPEDRRRALATGFDGYACKPIDTAAFLRTVKDVLRVGVEPAGGAVAPM